MNIYKAMFGGAKVAVCHDQKIKDNGNVCLRRLGRLSLLLTRCVKITHQMILHRKYTVFILYLLGSILTQMSLLTIGQKKSYEGVSILS